MRALYEIQHAEPDARAFETFIAVTVVGAERETDRSSALAATPVTAINRRERIHAHLALHSVFRMRHVRSSSANLYNSDHSSDCV